MTALTLFQLRFVNKAFWRNPAAAVFTFVFPLTFLVIFTALLGDDTVRLGGHEVRQSTYYVAEMGAFAVISACYTNLAITLTFQRDGGVLKRTRGTPLPSAVYFAARVLHSVLISVLLVALTVAFGRVVYGAAVPSGSTLLRFLTILLVGAAAFCAIAFALTIVIPNADASPPLVNATIMPLLFLSGIFIPMGDSTPGWVNGVSRFFPVKHFADAMRAGYLGDAFHWSDVVVVALWGLGGLLVAVKAFDWEPRV